jgi:prepilin-type N-terminal cleavage/methylation domain-containing protein
MGRTAFTLVELLVVVVIAATLAVAAGPSVTAQVRAAQALAGARGVMAAASFARHEAVRRQVAVDLRQEGTGLVLQTGAVVLGTRPLPEGTQVRGGTAHALAVFRPDGSATEGLLAVRMADGRVRQVRIDGPTGLARMENP